MRGIGISVVEQARPKRTRMRTALLASSMLMAATPAIAVDATWNLVGTGDYNTAANWTPATLPPRRCGWEDWRSWYG